MKMSDSISNNKKEKDDEKAPVLEATNGRSPPSSSSTNKSSSYVKIAAIFVVLCIFGYITHESDALETLNASNVKLGTGDYDIQILEAPVATSTLLTFMGYLLSQSRLGPALRRKLLNDNGIVTLREMANPIKQPPLHFPMKQVVTDEVEEDASFNANSIDNDLNKLISFAGSDQYRGRLKRRTIVDYARAYRNSDDDSSTGSRVLPCAVMNDTIKTVRQWEKEGFVIFSSFIEEDIMRQCKESEKRFLSNQEISIFDGVPIVIKDMIEVKGHVCYNGKNPGKEFSDLWTVSKRDDIMVERLRSKGFIILGTTVMTEGGVTPLGWSAQWQGPVNPYNPLHYSGGSSSGSAVAVSTGLVPAAIGFDGGGSIRIPSSMSGIHGLAATFGRIPFDLGTDTTMIKAGPMTASAVDAALVYSVISPDSKGHVYSRMYDRSGRTTPPASSLKRVLETSDLKDVRIGVFEDWFNDSDEKVRAECNKVLAYLESKGATVVPIRIPHLRWMSLSHGIKIASEFALGWDADYNSKSGRASIEPNTKITIGLGNTVTALEALAADKIRAWAFDYVNEELFGKLNLTIIANPTLPELPPELTDKAKESGESNTALVMKLMKYIFLANFLGNPGYSVPIGYISPPTSSEIPLPVGFHMMANHWGERHLLRLALSIEQKFAMDGKDVNPVKFHDVALQKNAVRKACIKNSNGNHDDDEWKDCSASSSSSASASI